MTLAYGLIGAGVLLVVSLAILRVRGAKPVSHEQEVVRVTRKSRPQQAQRKPGKTHVGVRVDRP